jgi:hypothetical protein
MSQRPTGFDICLPGMIAGLILAAVLLAIGNAVFPDPIRQVFPHRTFVLLSVAMGAASAVGFVSAICDFRTDEENRHECCPSRNSRNKNRFPLGGTDAL